MTETATPEAPPADTPAPPPATEHSDHPIDRLDRMFQLLETIAPMAIQAAMGHLNGHDETPVYGGIACETCRSSRNAITAAVHQLQVHLEEVHDLWPASIERGLTNAHQSVDRLSHALRIVDRPTLAIPNGEAAATAPG